MNKVSLLAASVAIALAGCGGSDGGSNAGNSGVVITGFDGYFKDAVVFEDLNNNGKLDSSDPIIDLTNEKGQVQLTNKQYSAEKNLAIQTIVPGGEVQAALIARDPNRFAGTYTVDMDNPTQAMAHEVVFRTLPGEKVISPLTDLVVIQAGANPTETAIQEAKEKVNETLGIEGNTAFTDVIAANNKALHKTAQILTESKAQAKDNYSAETSLAIADKAAEVVQKAKPEDLEDENFKPVVEVNDSGTVDVVTNSKLFANEAVVNAIKAELKPLESHTLNINLSLAAEELSLFKDQDNSDIEIAVKVVTLDGVEVTGLTATAVNGGELTISGELTPVRPAYQIKLTATDYNSEIKDKSFGSVTTAFDLQVKVENPAPTIDQEVAETIEEWIESIELFQGVEVQNEQYRIDNLFSDNDELTFDAYTSVDGLVLTLVKSAGQTELKITGKPAYVYADGQTITISAFDGVNTVYQTFELDDIEKQPEASIEIDREDLAELQSAIKSQLADLKVGEAVDVDFNITEVFEAQHTSGVIEYYAGTEDDEYVTTVPGLKVNVDTNGTLTISGTPTSATKGGSFVIAAGVNPDAEDAVISEYVTITLPNVQPADEVTPPPSETTSLEGKTWFFTEYGLVDGSDSEKGNDQIWCDSIKFDGKKVFTSAREAKNLTSCSEEVKEWEGATYTVSEDGTTVDASLPMTENGETFVAKMRYELTRSESDIAKSAATVYMQEMDDAGLNVTHSQRYTFFSDKVDLEKRLNIQSDAGWDGRVFSMYLPTNSGLKLGTVSLSMEENDPYHSDGAFDADITFDVPGEDFTCEMAKEVFRSFTLTNGENVYVSSDFGSSDFECHTSEENEVYYSTIDFDLPSLVKNDVYSFLGKTTDSGRTQVEQIKFNMEWTGVGNDD
ncbi:hypothetical protein [Vibrio alfacsensis]|uniref:hypothetical protein n=1 Tax=Vibrio alfacsensis TaxID=1074311 RepID=UPI001BEF54F1|nr:hypothetical protein [Vibrio alfacsensis]BCN22858.1 lipoprotein [Vibrio alfacsensis]